MALGHEPLKSLADLTLKFITPWEKETIHRSTVRISCPGCLKPLRTGSPNSWCRRWPAMRPHGLPARPTSRYPKKYTSLRRRWCRDSESPRQPCGTGARTATSSPSSLATRCCTGQATSRKCSAGDARDDAVSYRRDRMATNPSSSVRCACHWILFS